MNKDKIFSVLLVLSVFVIFGIVIVTGARLPTIGGDSDLWGSVLNEFLQEEHGVNGTHTNITATRINVTGNMFADSIELISNLIATSINITGDFSINNASGTKLLGLNSDGDVKVERGIILGNYASKPTCDATHLGMMVFDTVNNKPYVCVSGNIWNPLDSDYDSDGIVDWLDNDDTVSNALCTTDDVGFCFINKSSKSLLDTDLISSNIKSGINIFGVAGNINVVDTSSGDAIASDILSGKKAWVDGSEITGNITSYPIPLEGWSGNCIWKSGNEDCPAGYPNKHTRVIYTTCQLSGGKVTVQYEPEWEMWYDYAYCDGCGCLTDKLSICGSTNRVRAYGTCPSATLSGGTTYTYCCQ